MEDTNPFKEKEEIKQDIPVDSSLSKAEEELSALAITTEKYKSIVIMVFQFRLLLEQMLLINHI